LIVPVALVVTAVGSVAALAIGTGCGDSEPQLDASVVHDAGIDAPIDSPII